MPKIEGSIVNQCSLHHRLADQKSLSQRKQRKLHLAKGLKLSARFDVEILTPSP